MNSLPQVSQFTFNQSNEIRTVLINNDVWFVAKDVFETLAITWNGLKTLSIIPDTWRLVVKLTTKLKNQHGSFAERTNDTHVINFKAVCKIAFRSNKPEADSFTNWAAEVIEQVLKTGKYDIQQTKQPPQLLGEIGAWIMKEYTKSLERYLHRSSNKIGSVLHTYMRAKFGVTNVKDIPTSSLEDMLTDLEQFHDQAYALFIVLERIELALLQTKYKAQYELDHEIPHEVQKAMQDWISGLKRSCDTTSGVIRQQVQQKLLC